MIIAADAKFNNWIGYIVFVALPELNGVDGMVTYALGPFADPESAQLIAVVAQRDNPDAFVRFSPLRHPAPVESPIRAVTTTTTPYYVAARLAEWAYTDSGLTLDRLKLETLLKEESVSAGYLPDDAECREFICGADDGQPPEKLVRDFPKTNAYIEGNF